MPHTEVLIYREADGAAPAKDWMDGLADAPYEKCLACVDRLMQFGYELRRPTAELLKDGIYELRATKQRVNYRLLYFFHGKNVAVLAHGCTKEGAVDPNDIKRARERRDRFVKNPKAHTYTEE